MDDQPQDPTSPQDPPPPPEPIVPTPDPAVPPAAPAKKPALPKIREQATSEPPCGPTSKNGAGDEATTESAAKSAIGTTA